MRWSRKQSDTDRERWLAKQAAAKPGFYYGDGGTLHSGDTIDIVLEDGKVTEVWFRCQMLRFHVANKQGFTIYGSDNDQLPKLTGVELQYV